MIEGAEEVTLFGEKIQVNAKIHNLEGFSGHADMDGLLSWLKGFQKAPKQIFLVHGEPETKIDFARTVKEKLGYDTIPVNANAEFELENTDGTVVDMKEAMAEAVDERTVNTARENLFNVRRRLEDIIYNADLSVDQNTDPEKLARINNIILELEKSAINLGATISESDEDDGIELSAADIEAIKEEKEKQKK